MHTCIYEDPQEKYKILQINDTENTLNVSMLLYNNGHFFISLDN